MYNLLLIVLFLTSNVLNLLECKNNSEKIIIIGGSVAGLATASKLYKDGYHNIQILEANSRIGGFIDTQLIRNGSHVTIFERGDVLLTNYKVGSHIYNLTKRFDLVELVPDLNETLDTFYTSSGFKVSQSLKNKMLQLVQNIHLKLLQQGASQERSTKEYITTQLNNIIKRRPKFRTLTEEQNSQIARYYELFIYSMYSIHDWNEISISDFDDLIYGKEVESYVWKKTGSKVLIDILLNKYPNPTNEYHIDIKVNKTVTNIDYNNDNITIRTSDLNVYYADKVVVALPFGILKHNYQNYFTPPLPDTNSKVIKHLGVKNIERISFEFETKFWIDLGISSISILWTNDEYAELENTGKLWMRSIFGIFQDQLHPNILSCWFYGPYTKYLVDVDTNVMKSEVLGLFQKLLDNKTKILEPKSIYRTNYLGSPFYRGRYSYKLKSGYKQGIKNSILATPIPNSNGKNKIFFAGEATSDQWYGMLEGEIETGYRAADEIILSH